ncbi:MAG: PAS domain S-box protein [Gammaproteobacteria bacterium]|nr:PAS domain S-box protein [Gammaproteobacteria bacterium]
MKSLQSKIIIAILLIVLLPFLMMVYVHYSLAQQLKNEIAVDFLDVAHLINDKVQDYQSEVLMTLNNLSLQLRKDLSRLDPTGLSAMSPQNNDPALLIRQTLQQFLHQSSGFRYVFLLDSQFNPLAAFGASPQGEVNSIEQSAIKYSLQLKSQIDDVLKRHSVDSTDVLAGRAQNKLFDESTPGSEWLLPLYLPVTDYSAKSIAHLLIYMNLQAITAMVEHGVEAIGSRGEGGVGFTLLDLNGNPVVTTRHTAATGKEGIFDTEKNLGVTNILSTIRARLGDQPTARVSGWMVHSYPSHDTQLINYFLESSRYAEHDLRWIVVINQTLDKAYRLINEQYLHLLMVAVFNLLLIVIIGLWFGKRVSTPLRSLIAIMDDFRNRKLPAHITGLDRQDEIGDLARTFEGFSEYQRQHETLVEQHLQQYHQLIALQGEAEDLLMGAADGIIMVDMKGIIQKVNTAAYALFAYAEGELIGSPIEILVPGRYHDHVARRQAYVTNPQHRSMAEDRKLTGLKKDGSEFRINVALAPAQTSAGKRFVATIHDITKETQYQEDLRKLATVAESTSNLIAICDKSGQIEWVNTAFEAVLGQKMESVRGKALLPLLFDQLHQRDAIDRVTQAFNNEQAVSIDNVSFYRDGTQFWLTFNFKPVLGEQGLEHYVMIAIDITTHKVLQEKLLKAKTTLETKVAERTHELSEALQKADEAATAKANFLATMSHEIRTPINGVMGMTELLKKTTLENEQYRMLNVIQSSSIQLRTIIDDILDFTKMEAGKLELKLAPVCIRSLLREVGDLLDPMAKEKALSVVIASELLLPDISADAVRIRQILFNLLGNSIKFTPAGGCVSLFVNRNSSTKDNIDLDFRVEDNGIGISTNDQKKLFQPFSQVDGSITRRFGGTGLGLSIVTLLVELMDGSIRVESEPEQGSQFTVHLRFQIIPNNVNPVDLHNTHIILLDDSAFLHQRLQKLCLQARAKLSLIARLDELDSTLGTLVEEKPVLVIAVRENDPAQLETDLAVTIAQCPQLRVVLLVPHLYTSNQPEIATLVTNPLYLNDLLDTIQSFEQPKNLADGSGSRLSQHAVNSIQAGQDQQLKILVAEDNPVNQDLFRLQLDLLGYDATIVSNGREALEEWISGTYSMLLTDCHMPEMDGFQLAQEIRRLESGSGQRFPVIAVSADVLMDHDGNGDQSWFDDYVSKPLDLESLSSVIRKWKP